MGGRLLTNTFIAAFCCCCCFFFLFPLLFHSSHSSSSPLNWNEKYYESEVIKCKDGSNSFTGDRINDNFCDCLDGTDEPGTSACPTGKFYCKNVGSTPEFLFSSRVNDYICDCCDGSDEYDGNVICPNTCIAGGNFAYRSVRYDSTIRQKSSVGTKKTKLGLNASDSIEKVKGLKVLLILEVVLVTIVVAYWVFHRRGKFRRRHSRGIVVMKSLC